VAHVGIPRPSRRYFAKPRLPRNGRYRLAIWIERVLVSRRKQEDAAVNTNEMLQQQKETAS
jgi:hypothetical protein